jgi:hypothetical protein
VRRASQGACGTCERFSDRIRFSAVNASQPPAIHLTPECAHMAPSTILREYLSQRNQNLSRQIPNASRRSSSWFASSRPVCWGTALSAITVPTSGTTAATALRRQDRGSGRRVLLLSLAFAPLIMSAAGGDGEDSALLKGKRFLLSQKACGPMKVHMLRSAIRSVANSRSLALHPPLCWQPRIDYPTPCSKQARGPRGDNSRHWGRLHYGGEVLRIGSRDCSAAA